MSTTTPLPRTTASADASLFTALRAAFPADLDAVGIDAADAVPPRHWRWREIDAASARIANLLASPIVPTAMTVTIQKELGDRMMAAPGSKDYGALSIWVQSQCRVELVRSLPPSVFWPRPKVTSSVMQITLDPELRGRINDLAFFHDFVRSLFTLRRKFLRGALVGSWKGKLDKAAIDRALASAELDPEGRAEQLDVPAVLRLSAAMQAEVAKAGEPG